jgi:uncharacterized protein
VILLDTTVLVYAKGEDHPLHDPCRDLIAAIADRRLDATTTVEVIQEFVSTSERDAGIVAMPLSLDATTPSSSPLC